MKNQWLSEVHVWTFVLAYIHANELIREVIPGPNTELFGRVWKHLDMSRNIRSKPETAIFAMISPNTWIGLN